FNINIESILSCIKYLTSLPQTQRFRIHPSRDNFYSWHFNKRIPCHSFTAIITNLIKIRSLCMINLLELSLHRFEMRRLIKLRCECYFTNLSVLRRIMMKYIMTVIGMNKLYFAITIVA
ncbi:hypothetical protein L9F63_000090, partial [Diploptera punctata]